MARRRAIKAPGGLAEKEMEEEERKSRGRQGPLPGSSRLSNQSFCFFERLRHSSVMSSRVFPLVSGTSLKTNRAARTHITP